MPDEYKQRLKKFSEQLPDQADDAYYESPERRLDTIIGGDTKHYIRLRKCKEEYDRLSARVRELEHAKELLSGLNEASPGYEGIPPDAKCSSCGTPYSKHFRFDADGNIESTTIRGLCGRPNNFKSMQETATMGATNAANIGTVVSPQLSPGKARGKKSYTGSPTTGSGTKAPPQPVVKQPKKKDGTAVNALDMKGANLFGSGTVKRS